MKVNETREDVIEKLNNGCSLEEMDSCFRDDEEIVKIAVTADGFNLKYASERLQDNEEIVKIAVTDNGYCLRFASSRLQKNRDMVLFTVQHKGYALQVVEDEFKQDAEIVETAVKSEGRAIQYTLLQEEKEESKRRIKNAIKERRIKYFVHFTNAANLKSILSNGIFTRNALEQNNMEFHYTDGSRWDGIKGTSLSVSFPNYLMFRKKREDIKADWCVMLLDAEKVLEKECLFFSHNAACYEFQENQDDRYRYIDFESMFAKSVWIKRTYYREFSEEATYYTTSPQAEVMCLENIPKDCIKACVFESEEIKNKYEMLVKLYGHGIEAISDGKYFTAGPYMS